MEIICKNCNASHYLSDDKIPLETKTGKCKKCGSLITVLGKNASNSDSIILQEISTEPETTKNCEFCGEKILVIAKKCRYCGSMLDGSHASDFQNEIEQAIKPSNKIQTDNIDNKIDDTNSTKVDYSSNRYKTTKKIIKILALTIFLLGISIAIIIFFKISQLPKDVTTILEYRNGIAYLPNNTKPFTGKFIGYYSKDNMVGVYALSRIEDVTEKTDPDPLIGSQHYTEDTDIVGLSESWLEKFKYIFFNEQKFFEHGYKDGKLHGLATSWEENGRKIYEINYENGKLKGLSTVWFKDGKKLSIDFTGTLTNNLSEEQIANATKGLIEKKDDIEDYSLYQDYSSFNYYKSLKTYKQPEVYLYISIDRIKENHKRTTLTFRAQYVGDEWIFINSFIIVADGQKFEKENVEFRQFGGNIKFESYSKDVDYDDLAMIKAIIESNISTIRFRGSHSYEDYEITAQEKQSIKNVLNAYEALGGQFENWDK